MTQATNEAASQNEAEPTSEKVYEANITNVRTAEGEAASAGTTGSGGNVDGGGAGSEPAAATTSTIEYADFAKVELRVARVLEAERVPKADKLLKLQVDLGSERRQILAGIAQQFEPESLIGKTIVVVANLAPRKMRGLESQGMLLAASADAGSPPIGLLTIDANVPPGSIIR